MLRHRRRAVAAGLAVTAAVLVAAGTPARGGAQDEAHPQRHRGAGWGERERRPVERVRVPVRIADAGSVRLLHGGDRVDVIATGPGGAARWVATGARVDGPPHRPVSPHLGGVDGPAPPDAAADQAGPADAEEPAADGSVADGSGISNAPVDPGDPDFADATEGALVVLVVPRPQAAALAGAAASTDSQLAVTLR